ncbi:cupin domain-containing protein [Snodgrassella sp. CFCC 13594]|uniref:cupin domain-containing protein n=1 Tax=Snodgrassella sp. CFCC 13594 TaxID=1775559 RepID=UPI0008370C55|nr:cupin domain-containing protein [Snodgrassella sp. CFCC 13594]
MTKLIRLPMPSEASAREDYYLPAEKLISGNPKQSLWPCYTNQAGVFHAGVWQSEPGKWRIDYTEDEYCEILSGVSEVVDQHGQSHTLKPGDRFMIAAGFSGTWAVLETTRKVYVVYEAAD